jgi:cation diffusion facilitator CzcD-associated flavoprotein CzcO
MQQPQFEAVIIGAGFGGMGMAIQLRQMGIHNICILEEQSDVGGTWHINQYPGLSVDIDSVTYSYSFEPNPFWSRTFATGDELKRYALHVAEKYDLRPLMRFGSLVEAAQYDEDNHYWTVWCRDQAPITGRLLIVATGYLSHPKIPDIKGLADFRGKVMHTAKWEHDYDLTGKRVAIIGTGATSVQLAPAIAPIVQHLSVFQRTPVWVMPKTDVPIPKAVQQLFYRLPITQRLARYASSSALEMLMVLAVLHYQEFPILARSAEQISKRFLKLQIKDPVLRQKLLPNYSFGCKRPARSNEYWPTFNRNNVSLVTEGIERIVADGIITTDGKHHPIDTLLMATGFKVWDRGNTPAFEITGKNGLNLFDFWMEQRFQAYEGLTIPNFPNLFNMPSPFSFTGLSYFFTIEAHMRHLKRIVGKMYAQGSTEVEVTEQANREFRAKMMDNMQKTVFVLGNCSESNSYYFNSHGEALFLRPTTTPLVLWNAARIPYTHYHFRALPTPA